MKPVTIRAWAVVDKKTGRPVWLDEGEYMVCKTKQLTQDTCSPTEEVRRVTIIVEGKK